MNPILILCFVRLFINIFFGEKEEKKESAGMLLYIILLSVIGLFISVWFFAAMSGEKLF